MRIVFLGPPGAGKGTQAKMVERDFGLVHIATGDIIREAIKNQTDWGKKAEEYVKAGLLVPDEVVIGIMEEKLLQDEVKRGFILDGFPRTLAQAKALDKILEKASSPLDIVIYFNVDPQEVIRRLSARRICEKCQTPYNLISKPPKRDQVCDVCGGRLIQRPDDKEEVIAQRLKTYEEQTQPLIDFYRSKGILKEVVSRGGIEAVYQSVKSLLEEIRQKQ
ncbi:MAG: adenylate kinase [Candidatus Atribacteria bacterium]|jgi:adenylate kinase|uniref:Adenylate kinase n=1 Tax=Thermatribacter velox TaxID=3039681 RepID=A0ABZ2YD26_9BACT|nr:adenylate kinase [Candidatus Atribacteria bacterium]MDI3530744.1 adenylate kinase [Candidatus Atribacteria bacterium]